MPESVDDHIGMEVTHQAEVVARDYTASARHTIVPSARIPHVITPTTSVSDSLTTGQSDPSQSALLLENMSSSGAEVFVEKKDPQAVRSLLDSSRSEDDESNSPIGSGAPTGEEYEAAMDHVRKERKHQAMKQAVETLIEMFQLAEDVEEQAYMFRDTIGQLRLQMPKPKFHSTPFRLWDDDGKLIKKESHTLLVKDGRWGLTQSYLDQFQYEMLSILDPINQEIKELHAVWMTRCLHPHFRMSFQLNSMVRGLKEVPPYSKGASCNWWTRNLAMNSNHEVVKLRSISCIWCA